MKHRVAHMQIDLSKRRLITSGFDNTIKVGYSNIEGLKEICYEVHCPLLCDQVISSFPETSLHDSNAGLHVCNSVYSVPGELYQLLWGWDTVVVSSLFVINVY